MKKINSKMQTIQTIDEVIHTLDKIINECKINESPLGYFAALYRKVTIKIKEGVEITKPSQQIFQDNIRMEKLDVIFAKRYIDAYYNYQKGKSISKSWEIAFLMSSDYWPIVLQHLLIGMNAHINLDLGIAAAEVMQGKNIENLEHDFDSINEILASLVNEVQNDLAKIWPFLLKILKWTKKVDDFLIDFSMKTARDGAWEFAVDLSSVEKTHISTCIAERDASVSEIGNLVHSPGFIGSFVFKMIRLFERGSISQKIEDLVN